MRLVRLANLLALKYNFKSEAALTFTPEMKRELKQAFNNYVNADSPSITEPILQMLADSGEPVSSSIVSNMQDLIANLDHHYQDKLTSIMQNVVDAITPETKAEVLRFIDNNTKSATEAQRNHRKRLKSKFDTVTRPLVSILSKMLGKQKLLPQKRMELSKEKLLMFSRTPAAKKYGFDSLDVLGKLLQYEDTRNKLTSLINAVDRGHLPIDGPEIAAEAAEIIRLFKEKQNNESYFEAGEGEAQQALRSENLTPQEQWSQQMQESKQEKGLERTEEETARQEQLRMEPLIKQRDEEYKQKQIEEDRDRHVRSEASLLRKQLLKRYL